MSRRLCLLGWETGLGAWPGGGAVSAFPTTAVTQPPAFVRTESMDFTERKPPHPQAEPHGLYGEGVGAFGGSGPRHTSSPLANVFRFTSSVVILKPGEEPGLILRTGRAGGALRPPVFSALLPLGEPPPLRRAGPTGVTPEHPPSGRGGRPRPSRAHRDASLRQRGPWSGRGGHSRWQWPGPQTRRGCRGGRQSSWAGRRVPAASCPGPARSPRGASSWPRAQTCSEVPASGVAQSRPSPEQDVPRGEPVLPARKLLTVLCPFQLGLGKQACDDTRTSTQQFPSKTRP